MFEFFATIKHFQKHKQHTSKDAEFIALYADTNKLHKCLLQLNIFKNTNNTHQKFFQGQLQLNSLKRCRIHRSTSQFSATRFKCYNTSNDKIQQLYADTNKLHKCLNFCRIHRSTRWNSNDKIFKNTNNTQIMQNSSLYRITQVLMQNSSLFKNTNNTHQKMQNIALHDHGNNQIQITFEYCNFCRFKCYNTSNDKIQQLYADTNKLHKCLKFLLELNIFKNTNNTHQKMQNSSLYTMTQLLQPDSNATIHQTTRFSNCMQTRTNCISV